MYLFARCRLSPDLPQRHLRLDLLDVRTNVRFLAGSSKASIEVLGTRVPDGAVAEAALRDALWEGRNPPVLGANDSLLRWNAVRSLYVGGWDLPFMGGGPRDNLADDLIVMVLAGAQGASVQMLPMGYRSTG